MVVNTQSGVLPEITKRAITANVVCKVFVVSDGLYCVNDMETPFNMLIVGMTVKHDTNSTCWSRIIETTLSLSS